MAKRTACPKCKAASLVEWYSTEDMVKTGLAGAFSRNIFGNLFNVKDAIVGKTETYKCALCDTIYTFSQGSLFAPCSFCGDRFASLTHGYCCKALRCQKCYIKMWTYSQNWVAFKCAACGDKMKETMSRKEVEEFKANHDQIRKRLGS